jgi:hypothetical protein
VAAISAEFDILTGSRSPNEKLRSGRLNEAFAALQEKVNEARDQGVVIAAAGKRPFSLKLDPSVPFLGQSTLTIYDVRLPENGALPESDIGFWKVAKIFHFLATFFVHPWTLLTFHEPVPQMISGSKSLFRSQSTAHSSSHRITGIGGSHTLLITGLLVRFQHSASLYINELR